MVKYKITKSRLDNIGNDPLLDLEEIVGSDENPFLENCDYYEVDKLNSIDGYNLNVLHINIHSLPNKIDKLKILLLDFKKQNCGIDIILICETHINDLNLSKCNIHGYTLYETHRKNMRCGGIAIFVCNSLKFKQRLDLNLFEEGYFESYFIEIINKPKNIICGEIYRVPGTNEASFIDKYESILEKINSENKDIIIGTDQNLDYLKINDHANTAKFLEINLSFGVLPTITKPTRITHSTATLIDNIYVKSKMLITAGPQ